MSSFAHVEVAPPDALFNLSALYKQDPYPDKVDLGIGAYRTEEGQPWVLPVVRTIEAQMASDPMLDHEYLPILGLRAFRDASTRLLFGADSPAITKNRVCSVQTVSGTGALRLGFDFLFSKYHVKTVYISSPTWGNHTAILKQVGYKDVRQYAYYKEDTRGLDIEGMLRGLEASPDGAIVLLHACAHNPTGVDPTKDEWRRILAVVKEKKLFPFFDCAYQGFASGDVDEDAWCVRQCVKEGGELFVAQSFSKNFGLYNERVGQLCLVLSSVSCVAPVLSQLEVLSRRMWSNPPNHGVRIVTIALNNPSLYQDWLDNLGCMVERIKTMRMELYKLLKAKGTPGSWEHIVKQIGMFTFTGLTRAQCEYLQTKCHIYLLDNGRISMSGLNYKNLEDVAQSMYNAITTVT